VQESSEFNVDGKTMPKNLPIKQKRSMGRAILKQAASQKVLLLDSVKKSQDY
jgi:hypothetical protein